MFLFQIGIFLLVGAGWRCQTTPENSAVPVAQQAAQQSLLPVQTNVDQAYLMGQFDPSSHPDFVAVGAPYTDRTGMRLRREAFEGFKKMWDAAKKDGIVLKIISSTRTFAQQKVIWEGKWERFAKDAPGAEARALKILEYSSMPGSSRHHWGTDIDLNDLNNAAFETGGKYARVYEWLQAHAAEYGFGQPYTAKGTERPNGYNEERWHWSYLPLSKPFLAQYQTTVTNEAYTGFKGSETAKNIQIIENYVNGISKSCQP